MEEKILYFDYMIPLDLPFSTYMIIIEVFTGSKKVGYSSKSFEIPGPKLTVEYSLPEILKENTPFQLSLTIQNIGNVITESANLTIYIKDPKNNILWNDENIILNFTREEPLNKDFNLIIDNLIFGDYKIFYFLEYSNISSYGEIVLRVMNEISLNFNVVFTIYCNRY